METELQDTKLKLAEQKKMTSELNVVKKQAKQIETQFNTLQAEYESEKKTAEQKLKSYNDKCINTEQKLLEAQKMIADLESTLVLLKDNHEISLKEIQGIFLYVVYYIFEYNYNFVLESWNTKFDNEVLKAREEIEIEKSKYQKLLSEKRSIEEKLEIFERQSIHAAGDGLKRTASDLSILPYQEIEYSTHGVGKNVS